MKNVHHFVARLIVWVFLIVGLAFWISRFVVDASSRTIGGITRDNADFLDQDFRDNSPASGDIIAALYGSGDENTAYTMGRSGYNSGSCPTSGMNVEYFTAWVSSLPTTLSGNTIYVLDAWDYITTGQITVNGSCTAIVGNSDVYFYSTWMLYDPSDDNQGAMFFGSGLQYLIMDNISINGIYDGQWGSHTGNYKNYRWMSRAYVTDSTANNLNIYNNERWIHLVFGQHIFLNNLQMFNNNMGVVLGATNESAINNSLFHRNRFGIWIIFSSHDVINNCVFHHNNTDSDDGAGVVLWAATNMTLHQSKFYSNDDGIALDDTSTWNVFYGTLHMLANNNTIVILTWGDISAGTGTDLPSLGWANWTINTWGTLGREYLMNAKDTNDDYLLDRGALPDLTGNDASRTGVGPMTYSFWWWLPAQIQPVVYSGSSLIAWGSYAATFIWSDITKTNGWITIDNGTSTTWTNITVTITWSGSPYYRLFGDVTTEKNGSFSTTLTTGLTITSTTGEKYIFAQLRTTDNRTTHYWDSITLLDGTPPVFTWLTALWALVTNGWYYSTTWIAITFSDPSLSWATVDGSRYTGGDWITAEGPHTFFVEDTLGNFTGMTFTIDRTAPAVTSLSPANGSTITGNASVTFSRSWSDTYGITGYTLYISGSTITWAYTTTGTTYSLTLGNDTYYRYVMATDIAGNTWSSATYSVTLNVPFSAIIALSWINMVTIGTAKYTANTFPVYLRSNNTCTYTITWDITTGIWDSWTLTGGVITTFYPIAAGTDWLKTIYVLLNTGTDSAYAVLTGYLDATAPSTPTLISPTSGSIVTGSINLDRSASSDAWAGLSGYRYFISTTWTFATVTTSWFVTGDYVSLVTWSIWLTGTFYRYVKALDKVGNYASSSIRNFYYSGEDYTPDSFSFTSVTNARLNRTYKSNDATIAWLSAGISSLASIDKWALFINDVMVWTTGYVENGDVINIELVSSDEYDERVTSTITIGAFSTTFRVTTEEEDEDEDDDDDYDIETDLSRTERIQIAAVFLALRDLYGDTNLRVTFLNALLDALEDRIDELDDDDDDDQIRIDALQYLHDLIEEYLDEEDYDIFDTFLGWSNRHVAPNGKVYQIVYNSTTKLYTSPNFIIPKTFSTLDAIRNHIDINNGWSGVYGGSFSSTAWWNHTVDQTRQSAPYTAPNGKVYYLFRTTDGRYSSYTFTAAKYFISLEALKNHIYQRNH